MPTWRYTLTERDPSRPWIVLEMTRETVDLSAGADFWSWAAEHWPAPTYTVQLDPGQETRWGLVGGS